MGRTNIPLNNQKMFHLKINKSCITQNALRAAPLQATFPAYISGLIINGRGSLGKIPSGGGQGGGRKGQWWGAIFSNQKRVQLQLIGERISIYYLCRTRVLLHPPPHTPHPTPHQHPLTPPERLLFISMRLPPPFKLLLMRASNEFVNWVKVMRQINTAFVFNPGFHGPSLSHVASSSSSA